MAAQVLCKQHQLLWLRLTEVLRRKRQLGKDILRNVCPFSKDQLQEEPFIVGTIARSSTLDMWPYSSFLKASWIP